MADDDVIDAGEETPEALADHPALLLCDWAEEIGGKLYLQGAGIDLVRAGIPVSLALGMLLHVPWKDTNRKQKIAVRLVTEDGQNPGGQEQPFLIEGEIEVGRPPGSKPGWTFPTPLAFRLPPMALPVGVYRFELRLNGSMEAVASFRVVG